MVIIWDKVYDAAKLSCTKRVTFIFFVYSLQFSVYKEGPQLVYLS